MAIATFYLADLKKEGYTAEALVTLVPSMGVEVEIITENELSINVTPNRPDLLDFRGFVRALNNFTGKDVPKEDFYRIDSKPALTILVTGAVGKVRPYIAGIVVKNVDLSGNMLKYIINFTEKFADTYGRKRKKLAIGIHNLDVIKGDLVYDAAKDESFVPLGGTKKMSFSEIMERNEKGIAYRPAMPNYGTKDVHYPFLRDAEKVLALIPITNSEATRVTEKTKNIFIDITGTSYETIMSAASLIAASFMYAHCDVYPVTVARNGKPPETTPAMEYRKIKIMMKKADRTLGVETGRHNVIGLGNKMGYVAAKYGTSVLFFVPPYRVDVLNDQDVIEDIAVAYGYDKIVPLPIIGYVDGLADEVSEYENRVALFMVGMGYTEAINSSLTNEAVNFDMILRKYKSDEYVGIEDAKTMNVSMLRTNLLPGLLQNLGASTSEKLPQRIFEIGRTYVMGEKGLKESINLCVVSEHARADFAEARSIVNGILNYLGMGNESVTVHRDEAFIEGRCARISKDGEAIGYFGEVHPTVLKNFGLEEPVAAIELKLIREIKYNV